MVWGVFSKKCLADLNGKQHGFLEVESYSKNFLTFVL